MELLPARMADSGRKPKERIGSQSRRLPNGEVAPGADLAGRQ